MHSQHEGVGGRSVKTGIVGQIKFRIDPKGCYRSRHIIALIFSHIIQRFDSAIGIKGKKVDDVLWTPKK